MPIFSTTFLCPSSYSRSLMTLWMGSCWKPKRERETIWAAIASSSFFPSFLFVPGVPGVPGVAGQDKPETWDEGVAIPSELCGDETGLAPLEGTEDCGYISWIYSIMSACRPVIYSWSTTKGAAIKNQGSYSILLSLSLCSSKPLRIFRQTRYRNWFFAVCSRVMYDSSGF